MRDIDDPDPFLAERADDFKELLRLAECKRACWLVHDDQAGVEGQRFGDFHHLHLAGGEFADQSRRRELEADSAKQNFRLTIHFGSIKAIKNTPAAALVAQEDVRRDGKLR